MALLVILVFLKILLNPTNGYPSECTCAKILSNGSDQNVTKVGEYVQHSDIVLAMF